MTAPTIAPPGTRHAEVIAGAEAFAEFLREHPGLPLGFTDPLHYSARHGTDAENYAEVDAIAAALGTQARDEWGTGAHWTASRDFGGGLTYRATAISRRYGDAFSAHTSAFDPEGSVAA